MPFPGGRFFKRKATTPAFAGFDRTTVQASLPPAPAPTDSTRVKTDGDQQAQTAKQDDNMNTDAGRVDSDTRQAAPLNPKTTTTQVVDNTVKTGTHTSSDFSQPSLYQTYWNEETSHVLDPDVLENTNTWTPNAIALFEILNQTRTLSADHRDIQKRYPQYIDYATMVYYCYIFYIQILRARRSANVLSGAESRVLRRFERDFKPESLPIAGPLVPFFSSIVSTQIDDEQFTWVTPVIAEQLLTANMAAPHLTHGHNLMQPLLPYVVSILAMSVHAEMTQTEMNRAHANGDPLHWNENDHFVPFNFTATQNAATLWGIDFDKTHAGAENQNRLLASSGMTYPYVSDVQALLAARKSWMTSNFNKVRVLPSRFGLAQNAGANGMTTDGTTAINSLDNFLLMNKDGDSTFFEKLIENATIHARCFKGQQNLSQIPTVGGSETLILCTYQLNANPRVYANYDTDITEANKLTWYRNPFAGMTATFNTMIANPPRAETLQAFTFGINATLPVTGMFNARNANGYTPFISPHRIGPIWTHSSRKMEFRDEDGMKGKNMFQYFGRVIHSNLWNERLNN